MKKPVEIVSSFSQKQEAQIKKLRKAGKSIKAIAKELHVSDKRVSAFFRQGTPAKPVAPKVIGQECPNLRDQVVALRSKGLSIKAIAKKLHKSDKTVAAIVKRTGIGAPAAKKPCPKNAVRVIEVVKLPIPPMIVQTLRHLFDFADALRAAEKKPNKKTAKKPAKKAKK